MESYKGYKKTNLKICTAKGTRAIYICTEKGKHYGNLFYRMNGFWHGTFKEYCYEV
jgi:hypothetical protein